MGGNVEDDFVADGFLHTFALSKDKNKLNDSNVILTIKNGKKYEYMEHDLKNNVIIDDESTDDDSEALKIAKDVFGNDIVEIR